jgi:hypothetical protein
MRFGTAKRFLKHRSFIRIARFSPPSLAIRAVETGKMTVEM